MPEYREGDIFTVQLTRNGSSWYLLLPPDILKYLGVGAPENDLLAVKFEKGKWGKYIGVGIKKAKG